MGSRSVVAACVVATLAFAAYSRTLLRGVDLGDTGGFQAAVLWPETSARQAYPLYYALAKPFVAVVAAHRPALGLNLFSALCGAIACGLLTFVAARVSRSVVGGTAAGLLLAVSYTFWTQAVIAEVYTLHLALVGCCLAALCAWSRRQTMLRLGVFFALYAAAFGNHLSMILLLVPFAVFLLAAAERPAGLVRPKVTVLALALAALGALLYVPQLLAIWRSVNAPDVWTDRLAAFWFDVTKSDWRESMVLGVQAANASERLAMFAFDATLQFGTAGLVLGAAGLFALWRQSRPWAWLVGIAYLTNTLFAITYNVGDVHVFFLPGHYFVAFSAGAAAAAAARMLQSRRAATAIAATCLFGWIGWRAYDTWPAADRHSDRRAERLIARLTAGLDDRRALFTVHMNWQVENALLYETRYTLRHVTWTRLSDVLLYFPMLVQDNHATGRDVVLTADAARQVATAFGTLMPIVPDALPPPSSVYGYASQLPRGAPYVLAVLPPTRDQAFDPDGLDAAIRTLTGGSVAAALESRYEILLGRAGEKPLVHRAEARPFSQTVRLPEGEVHIRLDGWIPTETFRRAGFGHVFLDRRPVLTIERGISLAALGREAVYEAGVYTLQPRFRIPAGGIPDLALLH